MSMIDQDLQIAVTQFIAYETNLLNNNQWHQWLELFTEEGVYWMPSEPGQTDPLHHISHIYESASLRELRVRRFDEKIALSFEPQPRTVRHVSNIFIENGADSDTVTASASLLMAQYAYGSIQEFHGQASWTLKKQDSDYRIELKRVDLLNSDGYLSDILTYL